MDVEISAPRQRTLQCEAEHQGQVEKFELQGKAKAMKPEQSGENGQLFSKFIFWECALGPVLGEVACGRASHLFCIHAEDFVALQGKEPFVDASSSCQLLNPKAMCGAYCKCLPLLYSCDITPITSGCAKPLITC